MDFSNFWKIASEPKANGGPGFTFRQAERLWQSLIGRTLRFYVKADIASAPFRLRSPLSPIVSALRSLRGLGLRESFERDIRDIFAWKTIVSETEQNREPGEFDGDDDIGRCYLGSVINIFPSGKYYTPFACSNVNPCPVCSGSGSVRNPDRDDALADFAQSLRSDLTRYLVDGFGPACGGEWPNPLSDIAHRLDCVRAESLSVLSCPHCSGIGSREALEDEIYREALDAVAESHGGFIESGDGDGCDVFFSRTFEPETAETE